MVVGAATPDCEAGLRLRCAVVTPCPHLRLGPPFQAIAFATRSSACSSRPDRRLMHGVTHGVPLGSLNEGSPRRVPLAKGPKTKEPLRNTPKGYPYEGIPLRDTPKEYP